MITLGKNLKTENKKIIDKIIEIAENIEIQESEESIVDHKDHHTKNHKENNRKHI